MTNEELEEHFQALGWRIEQRTVGSQTFIVVHDYVIPAGTLTGRLCDIALERTTAVPYVAPPAIHTHPALVAMNVNAFHTHPSALGADWQYWSRLLRKQPTPQNIVTHIATIFSEV